MLGKLLKYELNATGRKFLPLYGAILIVSLFVRTSFFSGQNAAPKTLITLLIIGLFVALGIITLMTIVQRFRTNLLSDEGYLMFTLPVSTEVLICSKMIAALIWAVFSAVVSGLSLFIIGLINDVFSIADIRYALAILSQEHILLAVTAVVCVATQFIYFVLLVYTSLSVSQIPAFNKHRGIVSFVTFMVITVVVNVFIEMSVSQIFGQRNLADIGEMTALLGNAALVNLSLAILLFFATDFILKKRLNLE